MSASNGRRIVEIDLGSGTKADTEACRVACEHIRAVCNALAPLGSAAVLNGLASVYLTCAMQWVGHEQTASALCEMIAVLPRAAAAIRAAHATDDGGGHA